MADRSDKHHLEASQSFQERLGIDDLTTTDHVFLETWFLICSHLGRAAAMRFWEAMERGLVTLMGVGAQDLWRGHQIAREWPDQDFSVVDCTSFAIMERLGIERALAFDRHFRVIRLGRRRNRALVLFPG
jgi:predicted nucleic acid-binding protein